MANNRLYLYCPTCERSVCLAKAGLVPGTWALWHGDKDPVERVDAFLAEHSFCGPEYLGYGCGIEVRYEGHPDPAKELQASPSPASQEKPADLIEAQPDPNHPGCWVFPDKPSRVYWVDPTYMKSQASEPSQ